MYKDDAVEPTRDRESFPELNKFLGHYRRGRAARVPMAGARIGPYILVDKLGSGAFGEVWKAIDQVAKVECAVKIFTPGAFR